MHISRRTSRPLWKFHPDIRMETEKQDDEPESPINRNDFAEPLVYSITNSMRSDISCCLSGAPPCVDSKQQMGMNMSSGSLTLIAALLSWFSLSVCILTKTHKTKKRKKKKTASSLTLKLHIACSLGISILLLCIWLYLMRYKVWRCKIGWWEILWKLDYTYNRYEFKQKTAKAKITELPHIPTYSKMFYKVSRHQLWENTVL